MGGERMSNVLKLAAICLIFISFFKSKSYAYIDSGSGSYILQFGMAFLMGGLFAVKIFWSKIKARFLKIFSKKMGKNNK